MILTSRSAWDTPLHTISLKQSALYTECHVDLPQHSKQVTGPTRISLTMYSSPRNRQPNKFSFLSLFHPTSSSPFRPHPVLLIFFFSFRIPLSNSLHLPLAPVEYCEIFSSFPAYKTLWKCQNSMKNAFNSRSSSSPRISFQCSHPEKDEWFVIYIIYIRKYTYTYIMCEINFL